MSHIDVINWASWFDLSASTSMSIEHLIVRIDLFLTYIAFVHNTLPTAIIFLADLISSSCTSLSLSPII